MVAFDQVEVAVLRMRDEFARGIRKRDAIFLELCAQLRDYEDPATSHESTEAGTKTEY